MKIDFKSFAAGAVLAGGVMLSVAAVTKQPPLPEISGLRFVVRDITPHGEPVGGKQRAVLRLARFYGKIDQESFDFVVKHETQELKLATSLDVISTLQTNDIIGLRVYEHTKLSPGSLLDSPASEKR